MNHYNALNFLGRGVPAIARTQLLKNKTWIAMQFHENSTLYTIHPISNSLPKCVVSGMSVSLIATLSAPKVPDMGEEYVTVAVHEAYTAQKG